MKEDAIAFQIKGHTYLLVQTGNNSITLCEKSALIFQTVIRYIVVDINYKGNLLEFFDNYLITTGYLGIVQLLSGGGALKREGRGTM